MRTWPGNTKVFKRLFVLGLLSFSVVSSWGGESVQERFGQAVGLFQEERYQEALDSFLLFSVDYPQSRFSSAVDLMVAKCYYHLGNLQQAISALQRFLKEYPSSSYRGNAHFLLGNCSYLLGDEREATLEYLLSLETTEDQRLKRLARNSLLPLLGERLSLEDLNWLREEAKVGRGMVIFFIGKRRFQAGNLYGASQILEEYIKDFPQGPYIREARRLWEEAKEKLKRVVYLGVLTPLSGEYKHWGESLLRGVKLAREETDQGGDWMLQLKVEDTEGDPVTAVKGAQDLAQGGCVAILGPLLSSTAVGAASVSQLLGVPLLTPTASQRGLASLGEWIFQGSVGAEQQGRALAGYATRDLGLSKFAVLAPLTPWGKGISGSFIQGIEENGGKVLAQSWYEEGSTDFRDQFRAIRKPLLAVIDSMQIADDTTNLNFYTPQGRLKPPEEWILNLDGLFVSADPQEAAMIAPQVAFFGLHTHILGDGGWDSEEVRRIEGNYAEGAVLVTDFYPQGMRWEGFRSRFAERFGIKPDRVATLSYDMASLVLNALKDGIRDKEKLRRRLLAVSGYQGVGGRITLRANGENSEVVILRIEDGKVVRLK